MAFLQRLTAAAACETTPITCDAPVSAPLSPAVDSDLLRFNVAEGELVEITVLNGTPAGSNFNAQWRLLTATGAPAASCGGFNDAVHGFDLQRDCGPLPASGNPYQIEVQDQGLNDTGTYRAAINGVSQCVPITTTTTTSTTSTTSTTLTTTTTTTTTTTISTTTTTAPPTTTSTTSSTSTSTTTSTTTTTAPPTTTSTTSTTTTQPPTTTTIRGNLPPDCSAAAASPAMLWPPNHQFVDVSVAGVRDPDGDPVAITITGVTQDEPLNGGGQGNTCPDATGVGTATASVRAEREGTGDGRVYHIAFTADDDRGGRCTGSVTVCVPHDQGRGRACVDQGALFDSTGPTCVGACTSGCAIEMTLSQPLCTGENLPPTLMQRLTSAQELVAQAAGTSGKKKAKRLMRRGIKMVKQAVGIAAKDAKKGEISSACAASVAAEFGNAKADADRWLHSR